LSRTRDEDEYDDEIRTLYPRVELAENEVEFLEVSYKIYSQVVSAAGGGADL
jgi:hypothetical protein